MSQFIPIQLIDLKSNSQVNFDLYIRLSESEDSKMILYKKKDQVIEEASLEKFKKKQFSNFYIEEKDYQYFIEYVSSTFNELIKKKESSEKNKDLLLNSKNLLANTFSLDNKNYTEKLIENLNNIVCQVIDNCLKNISPSYQKTFKKFMEISQTNLNSSFQKHPINVSTFSTLILMGLGNGSQKIISDVVMGALLHDVGMAKLPHEMIQTNHNDINELPESKAFMIKSHPQLSLDILKESKTKYSELTETIILQHHERYDGLGYPRRLKGPTINEYSMIVKFANDLDEFLSTLDKTQLANGFQLFIEKNQVSKSINPKLFTKIAALFQEQQV